MKSTLATEIEQALTERFNPVVLELEDDSHKHAGHTGASEGSHFNLMLVAPAFTGTSRMARHRMVYDALAKWVPGKIHALSIKAISPEEQQT
ncbi:BolA family protein [Ampullimonas aquatilis]|uniref:BolA family protein n=1 Tax=Ampullimonas aquatilis TaxID=1341549 RepID=UPI003C710B02